jgi:hypothetical protein
MSFYNIRKGNTVVFRDRLGAEQKAKVIPLLIFPNHVVVSYGNNGTVVNESNFVRVVGKK